MQRANIEAGFAVLQSAGIGSQTAYDLLQANPACAEILLVMSKSRLFDTTDRIANKTLFANLIHASSFLLSPPDKQPWAKKITIDALTNCFRMLDGQDGSSSFLTQEIQHTIMRNVHNGRLAKINKLLEKLQPLNHDIANKFFTNTDSYIRMAKIISQFDASNDSFIYFFQHANPAYLDILAELLMMERPHWLTADMFRILVDHIHDCAKLIHGFNVLHKFDLLDVYRDVLVARPDLVSRIDILTKENRLSKENITQIFAKTSSMTLFTSATPAATQSSASIPTAGL